MKTNDNTSIQDVRCSISEVTQTNPKSTYSTKISFILYPASTRTWGRQHVATHLCKTQPQAVKKKETVQTDKNINNPEKKREMANADSRTRRKLLENYDSATGVDPLLYSQYSSRWWPCSHKRHFGLDRARIHKNAVSWQTPKCQKSFCWTLHHGDTKELCAAHSRCNGCGETRVEYVQNLWLLVRKPPLFDTSVTAVSPMSINAVSNVRVHSRNYFHIGLFCVNLFKCLCEVLVKVMVLQSPLTNVSKGVSSFTWEDEIPWGLSKLVQLMSRFCSAATAAN